MHTITRYQIRLLPIKLLPNVLQENHNKVHMIHIDGAIMRRMSICCLIAMDILNEPDENGPSRLQHEVNESKPTTCAG